MFRVQVLTKSNDQSLFWRQSNVPFGERGEEGVRKRKYTENVGGLRFLFILRRKATGLFAATFMALMKRLNWTHDPTEWKPMIDSTKRSLRAVVLHNRLHPSISRFAFRVSETYANVTIEEGNQIS